MKIRRMETSGPRGVSTLRMITPFERALADGDKPQREWAPAQTRFWARTSTCAWAVGAVVVGLSLRSYYVREMLLSLVLFSLLFFSLTLVVLSVFFACYAGNQAAILAGPASRAVMALIHRGFGSTELARVPVVEDGRHLSSQRR